MTNENDASSVKYKLRLITNTEADGKKWGKNSCTTKIFK